MASGIQTMINMINAKITAENASRTAAANRRANLLAARRALGASTNGEIATAPNLLNLISIPGITDKPSTLLG